MWKAPQATADSPSSTSAARQSTRRASSAPYWPARSGTVSISGSSYWPRSAVYVQGTAPFSRIHATATEVSRPPEKAMPTRSPTGRDVRTLDTLQVYAELGISSESGGGADWAAAPRVHPAFLDLFQKPRHAEGDVDQDQLRPDAARRRPARH